MRGTVAKRIRKQVYGDKSLRVRKYYIKKDVIYSDPVRQIYQKYKNAENKAYAFAVGFTEHIAKPLNIDRVVECLQNVIIQKNNEIVL